MDPSFEDHPAALGLDGDPRCLELGTALQRLLDLLFDLDGMDRRGNPNLVEDADYPAQLVHDVVRFVPLKLPIDVAGQRHHTLLDFDFYAVGRDSDLPFQDVDCTCCDLVVRAFRIGRQADLDFFGDRFDSFDPPRGALRHGLLGVAGDKAGQGDHTSICSYPDMGGIDARFELELVENVLPKL